MSISTRTLIEAGRRRGLDITILSASKNTYMVTLGGRDYLWKATAFGSSLSSSRLMSDKSLTNLWLARAGYLVPEAKVFALTEKEEAMAWAKQKKTVVFKPVDGAHGFGITVLPFGDLECDDAWERVIPTLTKVRQVQVEEYIGGEDYRFLVVGGRCIYVIQRLPAAVEGDGRLSLRRLIERENFRPARGKTRYANFYSPIELDPQLSENLARGGMDLDFVPEKGRRVILRRVCNAGKGGTDLDVSSKVAESMKREAVALAQKLDMDVLAIDVRCGDINQASSLARDMHILELNATPGITLGLANWVADAVWDALLEHYA